MTVGLNPTLRRSRTPCWVLVSSSVPRPWYGYQRYERYANANPNPTDAELKTEIAVNAPHLSMLGEISKLWHNCLLLQFRTFVVVMLPLCNSVTHLGCALHSYYPVTKYQYCFILPLSTVLSSSWSGFSPYSLPPRAVGRNHGSSPKCRCSIMVYSFFLYSWKE